MPRQLQKPKYSLSLNVDQQLEDEIENYVRVTGKTRAMALRESLKLALPVLRTKFRVEQLDGLHQLEVKLPSVNFPEC